MKIALVHDWLTGMRGGERCLEALCELFPDAPIYTLIYVKGSVSETIERHVIVPSYLNAIPKVEKFYRYLLPLFPSAIQSFDFDKFDLNREFQSLCGEREFECLMGFATSLMFTHANAVYLGWLTPNTLKEKSILLVLRKWGWRFFESGFKQWDVQSNTQVHGLIANS